VSRFKSLGLRAVTGVGYGAVLLASIVFGGRYGLAAVLESSVRRVGAFIARRQEESYRSLERRVIEYVNTHFTDPEFTRTQVADHFGISVYALSRLVKDSLGIGLKEYATARRVELARQLLLTTQDSIVAISVAVGFSSPDYFSKVFKGYFNISPSQVRDREALV
jgi:two-component system response regulator YesN